MPRQLCLGQADPPAKRARSAAKAAKPPRKSEEKPHTFTILDRVPVSLSAHTVVWAALRRHASRQLIIDAEHPEEAFPADVVALDQLSAGALSMIADALAERRSLTLAAEKQAADGNVLAKRLDRVFEQEMEWLSIRNLLAAALPRATAGKARGRSAKRRRVLLLIDA
jgi:hypothetical protein